MNCLIIDDHNIARKTMVQLASQIKDLQVAGECESAVEAFHKLKEEQVDLLLLDIEMPGMSGIELVKSLGNKRPVIIFTTAKADYAVEAFELNVADYIVKPVTPARLIQAVERAREMIESTKQELSFEKDEFLFIRDSSVVRRLKIDDLLFVEAMGDYVKLHTVQKYYAVHSTLKATEQRLPADKFLRVHRSFLVAINKIDTIQDGMLMIGGMPVPVADAYRSALNKRMNIL